MWLAPANRRSALGARLTVFGLSATAAATLFGAGLGRLGSAILPAGNLWLAIALGCAGVLALARETVARGVPIPQLEWQVPRWWLESFWRGSAVFGAIMGTGAMTRQPSVLFHLYVLACIATRSASFGAVLGAIYGTAYVVALVYGGVAWRKRTPGELNERAQRVLRRATVVGAVLAPAAALVPLASPF